MRLGTISLVTCSVCAPFPTSFPCVPWILLLYQLHTPLKNTLLSCVVFELYVSTAYHLQSSATSSFKVHPCCGSYSSFSSKCECILIFLFLYWWAFESLDLFLLEEEMRTEEVPIKKHVAMSVLLHLCMHETCVNVSVCAPEWNYWTIGDAIILNYLKNLLHQFTFAYPKMPDCIFTSIGINWLRMFCQSWWI